ncbi:MAG TPA: sensor histidine kinase KdpD [Anaerolineales bacterium]|nr:sensor histidine kinase KdpD [Anaerolineales bacterium]
MASQPVRPDPDELLKQIQAEERARKRGTLKIFLGYAAGVGKTYAMLEAAHQRKAQGIDVVVGYVETHKRIETEAKLEGLDVLPRKQVEYHNVVLPELDVDAVFKRRPQLVLVDEFAHTNAPGSRHPKRYQDVEEILGAGIDVYTTFNIQHLESLNDVVAQVTGVIVHETVPDSLIDQASEIEVIDLPPDELLSRLKEGKVYIPEQAARAIQKFFRKGNLTALREMAFRRAAERVDNQMRDYMEISAIPGPWPATERLMICISGHPISERLVRAGRRLADELKAEWFAVHVQTLDRRRFSAVGAENIARSLRLAEDLGAMVRQVEGQNVPATLVDFARKNNVTKIVTGKPLRSRWKEIVSGSLTNDLIRLSGHIDVYIVSDPSGPLPAPITPVLRPTSSWPRYVLSILLVALITFISLPIYGNIHSTNLVMLYLAGVVISALYLGRGPSMLASILSVLAFDYFLVEPRYTFAVTDTEYVITFLGLFIVSIAISSLAGRVREQVEAIRAQEQQSSTLYALSRELTVSPDLDTVLAKVIEQISQTFNRHAVILLPQGGGLAVRAATTGFILDPDEQAVATWAYEKNRVAGRGTDTLPAAKIRYQPLNVAGRAVGVLGVRPDEARYLNLTQRELLDAYASLAALAIERAQLAEQARQAEIASATEKLQTALLNSISHDLRTPLVSITGALTSLDEQAESLNDEYRRSLVGTAREEADRLNRLVGNLLSMTRIESGAISLHLEPGDMQDVIGTALEQLGKRIEDHEVKVNVPMDFPLVPMDFSLIVQVVVNLLENAVKYSTKGSLIEVSASLLDQKARLEIMDRGVGIPPEDLTRVFDKFYRVQRPESVSGTGLGLSISKGIVEAHHGLIYANARDGGGTVITVELPLQSAA